MARRGTLPAGGSVGQICSEPRYKEIIARWESFWSLEDVGRPLWLIPTSPVLSVGATGRVGWRFLLQDRETRRTAIVAHLGLNKDIPFRSEGDYVRHVLRAKTHHCGLCVLVAPPAAQTVAPHCCVSAEEPETVGSNLNAFIREMRDLLAPAR